MGIVPGTFITSTTSLLLWFALLLLSQLRLMLMPSMVSMVMVLLVSTPMPPTPTLLPLLTLRFPHLPLCPLLLEDTLVLADMSPTLPESFMLPRERPRPRLTLLFSMEPMLDTPMPMAPTLMELTHTDMDMPWESISKDSNLLQTKAQQ